MISYGPSVVPATSGIGRIYLIAARDLGPSGHDFGYENRVNDIADKRLSAVKPGAAVRNDPKMLSGGSEKDWVTVTVTVTEMASAKAPGRAEPPTPRSRRWRCSPRRTGNR